MHCNIYQIYEEPLDCEDWMDADFLSDSPLWGTVANHIDDVRDRGAVLQSFEKWLTEHGLGTLANEAFVLCEHGRNEYFSKRYPAFQKAVSALCNFTLLQFTDDFNELHDRIADLEKTVADKYDAYILWGMTELMPIDEFLRTAKTDNPYYIGGICSYQF
ncbi:hypothetical protein [Anaerocolumna xylanovorans]|uniref:Uncharacterized protein n=1 Tax=Anaerocolumna xylanovorans DSM 12503 TaxID=1121345 RepID=A0A1M7YNF3_9FIRM|nr:hypothetical protein [Anaerocolumna xylanovorans]SHO54160.1 hypothetical protein SAMN02745217_04615 [Anaerocolumna xylanovorans DSM 12503]